MPHPKISILYPYFYPGYKAGGITQSIYNLSVLLSSQYEIQVLCLDHDFHDTEPYPFVQEERVRVIQPNVTAVYLKEDNFFREGLKYVKAFGPDYLYVNSIYNFGFLSLALYAARKLHKKVVIAPRGMLHAGGLKKGGLKKQVFLRLLKGLLLNGKTSWHATDEQEVQDIQKWFGTGAVVNLATDTPRPLPEIGQSSNGTREDETLRLVYYSLITSKKNLALVLEALQAVKGKVSLDIYGPTIEEDYWKECQELIAVLDGKVQVVYKGNVPFTEFAQEANNYHFMVLPSKGENFGHVVYECLSLGLPILLSRFTPWSFEEGSIGYYVELNAASIASTLNRVVDLDPASHLAMCQAARSYAEVFYGNMAHNCYDKYGKIFHL